MPLKPEFSRRLVVARVPPQGLEETIEASPEEREALARRFDLPAIPRLAATFRATPWRRGGLLLQGLVEAEVEQICVVTLEPFVSHLREPVERYYLAETSPGRHPTVVSLESLDEDDPDTIEGGAIDLGELTAETLALGLDPYPRKPGADYLSGADEAGSDDDRPHPFAGLSRLTKT